MLLAEPLSAVGATLDTCLQTFNKICVIFLSLKPATIEHQVFQYAQSMCIFGGHIPQIVFIVFCSYSWLRGVHERHLVVTTRYALFWCGPISIVVLSKAGFQNTVESLTVRPP